MGDCGTTESHSSASSYQTSDLDDYDSDLDVTYGLRAKDKPFICGVVEGFYGRPWSALERHELFRRMKRFGMNTYLYAPKDDVKHRAYWRDLYTVEEADNLMDLIQAATENDVLFVYSISPGIDITYSSSKDTTILRRKLDQVSSFGCKSFALLFDDIEPDMNKADKEVFQSFAHAQASVTNSMYEHLGQPSFMFCPTEYCATRAVPSVPTSQYLNTLGDKLRKGIEIMWTGPKVVSKEITINSIRQLHRVIQRPPLIWDNIHANDYDQRRVFLGPFAGRSPALIPLLAGVLTNPNCEFEANWVAMQTLAMWSESDPHADESPRKVYPEIRVETEGCAKNVNPAGLTLSYNPRAALIVSITAWLPQFYKRTTSDGNKLPPSKIATAPTTDTPGIPLNVTTCMTVTQTTQTQIAAVPLISQLAYVPSQIIDSLPNIQPQVQEENSSLQIPSTEPMEVINEKHGSSSESVLSAVVDDEMQVDEEFSVVPEKDRLTRDDLELMCDMFYLPHEHGAQAVHLLTEFQWLQSNTHMLREKIESNQSSNSPIDVWRDRAKGFDDEVKRFRDIYDKLQKIPNRFLLWSLNSYFNEMRGTLPLLATFIKWLGSNKSHNEAFLSGDQEPWMFRGGMTGELQRLLPIDGAMDLFSHNYTPDCSPATIFTIRPYLSSDEEALYEMCKKTEHGMNDIGFKEFSDLVPDLLIGGIMTISSQYCFVIENESGICGYAIGTPDARDFHSKMKVAWLTSMQEKYPRPPDSDIFTPLEEAVMQFHNYNPAGSEELWKKYPAMMKLDMLPSVTDITVRQRALACLLSTFKSAGARGVHCEVCSDVTRINSCYRMLGFTEWNIKVDCPPGKTVLTRAM